MELSFHQIKHQLNAQGFDIVPIATEFKDDVRLKPVSPQEMGRRHAASIAGLAHLFAGRSGAPKYAVERLEDAFAADLDRPDSQDLKTLFNRYGSDKSAFHDYHVVYGALLAAKRAQPMNILEIGLGTNNVDIPSNMGPNGRPGASVRAFRDWAPLASITGADVDRRILFQEDRITCHFVDQTNVETLKDLACELKDKRFDLIIDDGIHTPEGSVNTINFALPLLKNDGVIVIEDIGEPEFPFWCLVFTALSDEFDCSFIKERDVCLAIFRRKAPAI